MRRGRLRGVPTELPAPSTRRGAVVAAGARGGGARPPRSPARRGARRRLARPRGPARAGAAVPCLGGAAGGLAASAHAHRAPDERAVGLPRVALAAYAYSRTADDTDGAPVKPLPASTSSRWPGGGGRGATAPGPLRLRSPDAAIVNLYAPGAGSGCIRTAKSPPTAPVVTLSLGDTCVFRLAGVDRRTAPVHRPRAASRRPARVRGPESAHLPRRTEGRGRDGPRRSRSAARALEHHRPRNRSRRVGWRSAPERLSILS